MEAVKYPKGWFDDDDSEHHEDCPAFDEDGAECECESIRAALRVMAAEARHDMLRDR